MNTKIYCQELSRGIHNFYLIVNGDTHYLFSQKYKQSVDAYFQKPISIEAAIDFSKSRRDFAIINTMEKIPKHIRYFERCYKINILKKSVKSQQHKIAQICA